MNYIFSLAPMSPSIKILTIMLWYYLKGLIEFYVSRVDGLVVIERIQGKTLLITPEKPLEFVAIAQTELL